ncbi:Sec24 protein, putative [Entamoeba nuttalli P19]|uniref:Sec24 protein, putative n=1 Tax=Entamoeba nuttalli (strain P19) TaxID=1076696 RepID=K2HVI3_ENTNP|nr:Sec24 protein, putative [Entamoeba nuttalli P19]EKE40250.1 Sec24 protein, putative [Entamoeba nuttalli P19]|eukprot:XP_008857415.1 Sec24 protein, putative [Entamoeba nuttalli P19]
MSEFVAFNSTVLPDNDSMLKKYSIPLVLQITPFAEKEVPNIQVNAVSDMPRCAYCRAFMSKEMNWIRLGGKYICGYCRHNNEKFYLRYKFMERDGINSFPELTNDVYEFEYQKSMNTIYQTIIMIDTSYNFIQTKDYKNMLISLKSYVNNSISLRHYICIITYNTNITLYQIGDTTRQLKFPIIDEKVSQYTIPYYKSIFINSDNKQRVNELFDSLLDIEQMKELTENNPRGCCFGTCLELANDLLNARGGTIISVCGTKCGLGKGVLSKKVNENYFNSTQEPILLQPDHSNDFYQKIALHCSSVNTVVHMFLFENEDLNVPTISECCHLTNGVLKVYQPNTTPLQNIVIDLSNLTPFAFDCAIRLRQPNFINIDYVNGHYFQKTITNYTMPVLRKDSTFVFHLSINGEIKYSKALFQFGLSYITIDGSKRTRVFNIGLNVSSNIQDFMINLNTQATINALLSQTLIQAQQYTLNQSISKTMDSLITYKNLLVQGSFLPIYLYGMSKHELFNNKQLSVDSRYELLYHFQTFSPSLLSEFVPLLYKVIAFDDVQQTQLSSSLITKDIFVLVTNQIIVIVPQDIEPINLQQWLCISSLNEVESIIDWNTCLIKEAIKKIKDMNKMLSVVFTVYGSTQFQQKVSHCFIFDDSKYRQFL